MSVCINECKCMVGGINVCKCMDEAMQLSTCMLTYMWIMHIIVYRNVWKLLVYSSVKGC